MNFIHYIITLSVFLAITTNFANANELSDAVNKIIKGSTGEILIRELKTYGLSEDQLNGIVNYCNNGSNDKLACITINIYKTIFLNKHNFEICLSSYILYSGVSCLDYCIKNYQLQCLECLGEHIPFIFDCLANGHIDYRPDYT